MSKNEFIVEIDGRRALIDQASGEVRVLDERGVEVFRDRIQVAAGSAQGFYDDLYEKDGR